MLALTAGILAPTLAGASDGTDLSLMYEARFLGLPVGNVAIHLNQDQDQDRYAITVNGRATRPFLDPEGNPGPPSGIRTHRVRWHRRPA